MPFSPVQIAREDVSAAKELYEADIQAWSVGQVEGLRRLDFMGSNASLRTANGAVKLRMIVDRASIEVYANRGEVTFIKLFDPAPSKMNLNLFSKGGTASIQAMEAYRLQSTWLKREQGLGYFTDSAHSRRQSRP